MQQTPLRIITFNFMPIAYQLLSDWIAAQGHKHVLAVTTPGPKSRPTPSYIDVVKNAPRAVDVLVTTRLRTVATPLIRALEPDLIACFSFPYRIPPELCAIPKFGAVNIHPAVLPAYRGPNVMRQFYEGAPVFGATAHWIAPEYDTGNILSQQSAELPKIVTPYIMAQWGALIRTTIADGLAQAIAGETGEVQDESQATYAAPFTEAEKWLTFDEPSHVIQRKAVALNMAGVSVKTKIEAQTYVVSRVEMVDGVGNVGEVIAREQQTIVVGSVDGAVRLHIQP